MQNTPNTTTRKRLLVYVHDILVESKNNEEILLVIKLLGSHFDINNLGKIKKYLGI